MQVQILLAVSLLDTGLGDEILRVWGLSAVEPQYSLQSVLGVH
jgi:hypothetical protein